MVHHISVSLVYLDISGQELDVLLAIPIVKPVKELHQPVHYAIHLQKGYLVQVKF
jgi:hypothetical protein